MEKLTSINITGSLQVMENELLKVTGLSRAAFHRKAIDKFLSGDMNIDGDLMITTRKDPRYIRKPIKECIYLDDVRRKKLEKVSEEKNIKITILLFQAIMDYCVYMSNNLPQEELKKFLEQ